jgi:hypothetical protein
MIDDQPLIRINTHGGSAEVELKILIALVEFPDSTGVKEWMFRLTGKPGCSLNLNLNVRNLRLYSKRIQGTRQGSIGALAAGNFHRDSAHAEIAAVH